MKAILRLILLALVAGLGIWLWTVLFPGPEKVIRRRLLELARAASTAPNESDLMRLAAARSVAGYFATNVEFNVDSPRFSKHDTMDREGIAQAVLVARSRPGGFRVNFPDVDVTVARDRQSAAVDLTVEVNLPGERDPVLQEMKFTLCRVDGQWLITRVETVRTLS